MSLVRLARVLELFFLLGDALLDLLTNLRDLDRRTRRLQLFHFFVKSKLIDALSQFRQMSSLNDRIR